MPYTHHELKHKTLAELRDIAKDIEHAAHDHAQLKLVRRRIHRLKRQIHKATV